MNLLLPIYKAQLVVSIILAKRYRIVMFHVKQILHDYFKNPPRIAMIGHSQRIFLELLKGTPARAATKSTGASPRESAGATGDRAATAGIGCVQRR